MQKKTGKVHQRPNGTGTAYKRGKTWTARIILGYTKQDDGTIRKKEMSKGGFRSKTEALEYCSILRQSAGMERKKEAPTLEAYWNLYASSELEQLSKDKQKAYRIAWNRMKPLASRKIDTLTVKEVRDIVKNTTSTYYPARDMKVVFQHIFHLAAVDGNANEDLPTYIVLPKLEETERQPFTLEEQENLWKLYESNDQDAVIPLIMINTGMMPGEMMRLTTDMIDLDKRQIIGVGLKTKVRKATPVGIPVQIVPILEELMENTSGKLFKFSEDSFYKRYYAALEKAGCRRLQPYSCRHTTATALAITNNIAPETVRKIMRWSTTSMLQRYAHPDTSDILEALDALKT